jgi:hypothetical protein
MLAADDWEEGDINSWEVFRLLVRKIGRVDEPIKNIQSHMDGYK